MAFPDAMVMTGKPSGIRRRDLTPLLSMMVFALLSNVQLSVADPAMDTEYVSGWRFGEGTDKKLKPADGRAGDEFGASVSMCGSYAFIGVPSDTVNEVATGSVYVYKLSKAGEWTLDDKIYPPENGADGDGFGASVSCSHNVTAVGAPYDGSLLEGGGAVYVYVRHHIRGLELSAKLTSYAAEKNEYFGRTVAVSNDLVLAGATGSSEAGPYSGAVYAFKREAVRDDDILDDDFTHDDKVPEGWNLEAIIYPAEVDAYDNFGLSLSVSGSIIVIGAPNADARRGAAYVYNRTLVYAETDDADDVYVPPPSYLLLKRLTAGEGTTNREYFGWSVAIDAHTIVVGQPLAYDDTYEVQQGAAHIFTTHTSGLELNYWSHVAVLEEPSVSGRNNRFGSRVAIKDNSIPTGGDTFADPMVYAFGRYKTRSNNFISDHSSSHAYTTSDDYYSFWSNQAVLVPSDRSDMVTQGVENDKFGSAIAISDNGVAVVGALASIGGRNELSGAVYVYVGEIVEGGNADTDDNSPPAESWEEVENVAQSHKVLAWLVLLLLPACALAVCMYTKQRKRRRRGYSTAGGSSFGEGVALQGDHDDDDTISDLDSAISLRDIRGRVKTKLTALSSHAKGWVDGAIHNPVSCFCTDFTIVMVVTRYARL